MRKSMIWISASAVIIAAATIATTVKTSQPQPGKGGEWLAWSPVERNAYIAGFVDGYLRGSHKACLMANDLFEVGQPHELGHDPTARCESHLDTYSKYQITESGPEFSAYTAVITDFYREHPEYRNIPFVYLLSHLSDAKYRTAPELYQMALKGEMRTNF